MGPGSLSGAARTTRPNRLQQLLAGHHAGRDGRRAVRADLPDRLERRRALRARLLEPGRADGADEERRLHGAAADGAAQVVLREALLHREHLELALADVLDVL